jgi:SAM-dependent methyltransferase
MACGLAGANVTMTDRIESAIELSQHNASLNKLDTVAHSYVMDWNKLEDFKQVRIFKGIHCFIHSLTHTLSLFEQLAPDSCDIIVGSDLLYQARNAIPVLSVVRRFLKPGGLALFFDPGRGYMSQLQQKASEEIDSGNNNDNTSAVQWSADLFELFNVRLRNDIQMPELHVVAIQRGTSSARSTAIYNRLRAFVNGHQDQK